jgi:hypothetical protein
MYDLLQNPINLLSYCIKTIHVLNRGVIPLTQRPGAV